MHFLGTYLFRWPLCDNQDLISVIIFCSYVRLNSCGVLAINNDLTLFCLYLCNNLCLLLTLFLFDHFLGWFFLKANVVGYYVIWLWHSMFLTSLKCMGVWSCFSFILNCEFVFVNQELSFTLGALVTKYFQITWRFKVQLVTLGILKCIVNYFGT